MQDVGNSRAMHITQEASERIVIGMYSYTNFICYLVSKYLANRQEFGQA